MSRRSKKEALGIFGLGALAKGISKGLDQKDDFNQLLAKLDVDKQKENFDRELKLAEEARKTQQAGVGNSVTTPTGEVIKSSPLSTEFISGQEALLKRLRDQYLPPVPPPAQQPMPALPVPGQGLVPDPRQSNNSRTIQGVKGVSVQQGEMTVPKSEFLSNPDKYKNVPNLSVVDDTTMGMAKRKETEKNLGSILSHIDSLESKFSLLQQQGKTGLKLSTAGTYIGGKLEQDPDAKDYMSLRKASKAVLGRNIGQDVGNFAEKEAKDYLDLMPSLMADPETAKRQFQTLRETIISKREAMNAAYGITGPQPDAPSGVPQVGEIFNGSKVKSIRRVN